MQRHNHARRDPSRSVGHERRIPDLAVTCSGYDAEESALANPVLLIEILSPSNQAETWAIEAGELTLESIGFSIPLAAAYRTTRLSANK
ncbi:hypothetical protein [Methylocapsa palsarum]|uniref:Restriction endonuclease n=1 Tax=Methylocapsa palsarum TaxID=1612308 RepID=A0A1I4AVI3_9HYPH|nr:hypothetical protein [Methylocapsa palsarum]SFK59646.1 hypothetical protein SAMN05444581_111110 [Methylocapsa palsarum]